MPPGEQNIDPNRSLKRSLDQLTTAVKAMTKHLESFEAASQGEYLEEQKESLAAKKVREAGWSVAQAKAPTPQGQHAEPGSLNPNASNVGDFAQKVKEAATKSPQEQAIDRVLASYGISQGAAQMGMGNPVEEAVRELRRKQRIKEMGGAEPGIHGPMTEAEADAEREAMAHQGLGWMDPEQINKIRSERMEIPQWRWTQEKKAQATRDLLIKASVKAGEAGKEGLARVLGQGGQLANKWYEEYALPLEAIKEIGGGAMGLLKGITGFTGQTVEAGTTLGYEGGNALGGQFLPGGIPNPLAIFSSAGQENLGQKFGAFEQALRGNLPLGQSMKISNALAGQGFANTESGGNWFPEMMNWNNRGRNQELTELFSEGKWQGLGEKQFLAMSEGIKFGGGSIEQLTENIKGLGKAAKDAEMTTNMLAESMTTYAQMTSKQGTRTAQEAKAKEITERTGLPAQQVFEANESELGRAMMARYGVLPGTGGATTATFQALSMEETIQQAAKMMGPGTIGEIINPITKVKEPIAEPIKMQAARMAATVAKGIPINVIEQELEKPGQRGKAAAIMGATKQMTIEEEQFEKLSPAEKARRERDSGISLTQFKDQNWGQLWSYASGIGISGKQFQEDFSRGDKGGKQSLKMLEEQAKRYFSNQEKEEGKEKIEIILSEEAKRLIGVNRLPSSKKEKARAGGTSTGQTAATQVSAELELLVRALP